jgi:hypothetical protein
MRLAEHDERVTQVASGYIWAGGTEPDGQQREVIEMSMFQEDADGRTEPTNLTGHPVIDDHHHKVGTVSDVLFDDRGEARWAVVDPGLMRAE